MPAARPPPNGNGASTKVPWQTVVMVLAAFIVGLFPFVIAQTKFTPKDDTQVIRATQIEVLQRLSNLESKQAEQDSQAAAIAMLQAQVATLTAQLQSILPGAGSSSSGSAIPGPPVGGPVTTP